MKTRKAMMTLIEKVVPGLWMDESENFDGRKGAIWTTAETGAVFTNGLRPFDYYAEDRPAAHVYEIGILVEFGSLLEKHGWYCEWYDAGTVMIYPM